MGCMCNLRRLHPIQNRSGILIDRHVSSLDPFTTTRITLPVSVRSQMLNQPMLGRHVVFVSPENSVGKSLRVPDAIMIICIVTSDSPRT